MRRKAYANDQYKGINGVLKLAFTGKKFVNSLRVNIGYSPCE